MREMSKPVDRRVDSAVRRASQDGLVRTKAYAQVVTVRPIDPVEHVRRASPGDLTMGQAVVRALAFLALITIPGVILLTVAVMFVVSQLTMATVYRIGGVALVVLALAALALNRTNHSGACPGIAVHCQGCKR